MITPETRAEVLRLIKAEHFSITKTAHTLGIHHSTVRSALENEGRIPTWSRTRASKLDPFLPLLHKKIEEYPDLKASTIWRMLKDRGFTGSPQTVRERVAKIRDIKPKKAFMPITAYAGDEGQVDWAHFGSMRVGKTQRKLSLFVMVLSYSRMIFAKFFYDQTLESFLAGHVEAFAFFGGVPRELRYDNLKAAVAQRYGQTIRYNPQLLELAGYYAFKPSACNPYSGHEKGRVERAVRYIRESFFVGRQDSTIERLNQGLLAWINDVSGQRPWVDDRSKTVQSVWLEEKSKLISLPERPFHAYSERPIRSGKIPFVRFDKNDYSIPFQLVGQPLSIKADQRSVMISHRGQVVANHSRSFSGGEKIADQQHFKGLLDSRPNGHTVAAKCYLTDMIPEAEEFFRLMVERGGNIGSATAKIFELIRTYGQRIVAEAVAQAVNRSYGEADYVARVCDQFARKSKAPAAIQVVLPAQLPGVGINVIPHNTASYDDLAKE